MGQSSKLGSAPQAQSQPPRPNQAGAGRSNQMLHPTLRGVLAGLDIQLEDELTRFRRQRAGGGRTHNYSGRKSATKMLDLISVAATGGRTNPIAAEPLATLPSPQGTAPADPMPSGISAVSELAIALQQAGEPLAPAPVADPLQDELVASRPNLDDYLESSEELLRSLATEEAHVQAERGFMESLLTPLGVGSMLLLLVSSAMFGYLVMNPASFSRLLPTAKPDSTVNPPGGVVSGPAANLEAPQPNLATQEFKDLNLNTLGSVQPNSSGVSAPVASPAPSPAAKTSPATSTTGAAPTSETTPTATAEPAPARSDAPAPTVSRPVSEAPRAAAPPVRVYQPPQPAAPRRVAPAPARPAPVAPAPSTPARPTERSSGQASYKLVTHYDSDRTLEAVRKVIPDAYVQNFDDGAKIQVGAYSSQAEAEARVQQLQQQGISVEVQKR